MIENQLFMVRVQYPILAFCKQQWGHVLAPQLGILEPPTDDVERFLVMLRFDAREKLENLPLK